MSDRITALQATYSTPIQESFNTTDQFLDPSTTFADINLQLLNLTERMTQVVNPDLAALLTPPLIVPQGIESGSVISSNVEEFRYNPVNQQLVLSFHDQSMYVYFDITQSEFEQITQGQATCVTNGKNVYGSWYIGKNPSVGAAVHVYLIATGKRYMRATSEVII